MPDELNISELRRYRLARVQEELGERDCAAVVLFQPQNIRYATDLRNMAIWTFYTAVRYAFVPASGLPVMFEYALDCCPVREEAQEFIAEVRPARSWATFYAGDRKAVLAKRWAVEIDELVRQSGGSNRRVAFDWLDPVGAQEVSRLGMEIVEGDGLMARARLIKSPEEITCLRAAVSVAELGMQRMREALRPGLTENQLWAILHETNIAHGGEWIETRLLTSGPRTNPWYQECSDKIIEEGELVVFDTDMIGPYGYCADLSRAYLCGNHPTDEQRRLYGFAHEQLHHNVALLRPGSSFREIAEQCWIPPEEFRAYQESIAHGVGLQVEFPLLCHRDEIARMPYPDEVLQPGMVLSAESYIGAVGGLEGVKLEQQVLITETGPELFSDFPFEADLLR